MTLRPSPAPAGRALGLAAAVASAILALLLLAGWAAPSWAIYTATIALAKGLVVLGLVMLLRMGLISFGHGMFYCFGAYVSGLLASGAGLTDALALTLAATLGTAALGLLLGLLLAGYRGVFFAMFNLALSMILYGALLKSVSLGGSDGVSVPAPSYFGLVPPDGMRSLAAYGFVATIACAAGFLLWLVSRSQLGLVLLGVKGNEIRLDYLGISARRLILVAYVLSAALAGMGGSLVAIVSGHVIPEMAYWTTSGEFVFITVLSGPGSISGAFAGAGVFEAVRLATGQYLPNAWQLLLGGFLLLVILFLPDGISSLARRRTGTADASAPPAGRVQGEG
ncbi:branched-chain amino acid ABC transporter permease [Paralimibaculum aggregatum]|uniref:Branched-chain amino acid ABC transporter permease n=1 Tax=Paralimibaculum aggregatum TaxID=3036245 RepID=A0ABQ6LL59_9RHOB|nr:branched-chain amino acid ABC transporter permease [Limibaculum sp. NKW23]GMG83957.1 branched-chain amino acid ABC transporter permease [Limibaculum sp. NKW23]